jgi:hypothetical protein
VSRYEHIVHSRDYIRVRFAPRFDRCVIAHRRAILITRFATTGRLLDTMASTRERSLAISSNRDSGR